MPRLQEALRARDDLARAWFRLRAGDAAGALSDARAAARATPDADSLHLVGISAAAVGNRPLAIRSLRRSLRLRGDGWVALHLVQQLLAAGRPRNAERILARLETRLPGDEQIRRGVAYVMVATDRLEAARRELEVLELRTSSAEAAFQLAVVLDELGEVLDAKRAAERAVERAPQSRRFRLALLDRLAALGDWPALVEAASGPHAAHLGGGMADYHRGLALAQLGRVDEGRSALAAVADSPDADPVVLSGAAAWLLQLGAYADAEEAARLALQGRPDDASVHHLVAMVLSRQQRETEALAHYRRASSAASADPGYRFDLLVSLCRLKLAEELEGELGRAAREFPDDPRFGELGARCPEPG